MKSSVCLYCYQPLPEGILDYHPGCSKKIFGSRMPPDFPYTEEELDDLALQVIKNHITVTGVQPKLSLDLKKNTSDSGAIKRFTIVGLWGGYILKPPTNHYPNLPEV